MAYNPCRFRLFTVKKYVPLLSSEYSEILTVAYSIRYREPAGWPLANWP